MNEIRLPSINNVQILGRLIKDCEKKSFEGGSCIINGCVAINDNYKSQKTNEWVERSYFVNFVINGKNAETFDNKLKKGDPILIEGKLQTRNYEDKNGNKRTFTEVVVYHIQNLIKKETEATSEVVNSNKIQASTKEVDTSFDVDEDIPF